MKYAGLLETLILIESGLIGLLVFKISWIVACCWDYFLLKVILHTMPLEIITKDIMMLFGEKLIEFYQLLLTLIPTGLVLMAEN